MVSRLIPLIVLITLLCSATARAKSKDRVEFDGLIQRLPAVGLVGDWIVGTRTVHVTSDTDIKQERGIVAGLGVFVEVKGTLLADGSINARDIDVQAGPGAVHEARFSGFVDKLPASGLIGDWSVNGHIVHVSTATDAKMEHGLVALNAFVDVKGFIKEDGSITADDITVEASPGSTHMFDFEGFVQRLPASGLVGAWMVNGRAVHVAPATELKVSPAAVALNAFVKIKGILLADGSISADEIEVEASPGSTKQFDFVEFVDRLPDGSIIGEWIVNGRTVHVATDTHVKQEHGLAIENALVKVKGLLLADGSVKATEINVEAGPILTGRVKLQGFVDNLPATGLVGNWVVSGRIVHVSVDTRIKQKGMLISAGLLVEVKGFLEADGTISATKITVKL